MVLSMGLAAGCVRARSSSSPLRGGHCPPLAASTSRLEVWLRCRVRVGCGTPLFRRVVGCRRAARVREGHASTTRRLGSGWRALRSHPWHPGGLTLSPDWLCLCYCLGAGGYSTLERKHPIPQLQGSGCGPKGLLTRRNTARLLAGSAGSWHLPGRMEDHVKFSSRRSPVAKAVRVLEFYVPSFGAAMLSGAPSADDACCSATPLHGSGLSSGAPVAAATSAGVMRAHFGARYTWPRRCCAGCRTAAADHLLLETMGCAAVGRSFVMSSNSTEAWDAQEWAVIELQHHPCRLFGP